MSPRDASATFAAGRERDADAPVPRDTYVVCLAPALVAVLLWASLRHRE